MIFTHLFAITTLILRRRVLIMSGMYNMIMGQNPFMGILFAMVGIFTENVQQFGRLRDAWVDESGEHIGILHRNYGENGAPHDANASELPTFVSKHIDDMDDTYGWYIFKVPEQHIGLAQKIAARTDNTPCMTRYRQAITDLRAGVDNSQTRRAKEAGKRMLDVLDNACASGRAQVIGDDDDVVIEVVNSTETSSDDNT